MVLIKNNDVQKNKQNYGHPIESITIALRPQPMWHNLWLCYA